MADFLAEALHEFRRYKSLADRALAQASDGDFFRRPAPHVNPLALIVKHLAGNLRSRWTDFLTTDGEKPHRDRDGEFELRAGDDRPALMASWEAAWQIALESVAALTPADLGGGVTIRGEAHSVQQALLRSLLHVSYHVGQILYLVRLFAPDSTWLTIAPGQSRQHRASYMQEPGAK